MPVWVNGESVPFERFPNGETRISRSWFEMVPANVRLEITWQYIEDESVLELIFLGQYFANYKIDQYRTLRILYMPYSRQDRNDIYSIFTLKILANLINEIGFFSVTVVDPHSDVTCSLIDRATAEWTGKWLYPLVKDHLPPFTRLMFPDAGAEKRYGWLNNDNAIVGIKHRDFATGRIASLALAGEIPSPPFSVLIIDDIISYGGTFIRSAERLREAGATYVGLMTAHCENSIVSGKLLTTDLVDEIFTTNTILSDAITHPKLHVFNVLPSVPEKG